MNMRRKLIAASLVLVFTAGLFGLALAQGTQPAGKQPVIKRPAGKAGKAGKVSKVVIENKAVQLGEVIEGQDYQHTFTIKNAGDAELQILSVRPG
jgi:Flp pilus assembly protein CpaB